MIIEERPRKSRQYECFSIFEIQLPAKVSIWIYVLGATTVKFIACYMFRSYGEFSAIKHVISKTRVKMLVNI
jgi:hypothetical protein